MSLPRHSTRRPVAVAMLFLAIGLLGAISWSRLPIDLLPDLAYPRLVLYTAYPEVAPAEVERWVTEPVEARGASVPGVERVTSVSRQGVSLVTLRFAWGTDMDFAMLDVRERMDELRAALPPSATRPRILRVDPDSEPVMVLSVSGGTGPWETQELVETVFRRRLEQLDGVARAAVTGGLDREIVVEVDPGLLDAYGLTGAQVAAALARANVSAPGGTIRQGRYRYPLRTLGELRTVEEIADVVVSPPVRLRDVARVVDGHAERETIARLDGREAVGVLLFKESGANTVTVARAVEGVLRELRAEHPGVRVDVASSQAGFIAAAIANVAQSLVLGGALAFLVLFLFLRDPRYPVVIALAIPLSLLATFALMDAAGVSLNVMSLGGLALGVGMLVDNSIVVLENVFRHGERGRGALEAAAVGAEEVAGAITASTLTTIAVFAPIVYVQGIAGELFRDLALAIAFSLLASLLVALTVLPAWAARFGGRRAAGPGGRARVLRAVLRPPLDALDRGFARLAERYHHALVWSIDRSGRVLGLSAFALAAALAVGARLPRDVLPDVDQGALEVRLRLPEGTGLEATGRVAARFEAALARDPGVEAVLGRIGRDVRAYGAGEESHLNTALLQVRVREGHATDDVLDRLRPLAAAAPEAEVTLQAGQATTLGRLLGGEAADIAVRIRAAPLDAAHAHARAVAARLEGLDRVANVRAGSERGTPELRVEILRDRAAAYGIDPGEVAAAVSRALRGERATDFLDFDRRIAVMVRWPAASRASRATLETLRVGGVPLRELVRVEEVVGPAEVRREDQGRVVTVLADVAAGGLDDAVAQVEEALRGLPARRDVRTEVGGENEEMRRSFRGLAFAFALAVALVYMILAAQFESFRLPLVVLMAVPLAVVGAVAGLALTGRGVDTMSLIGLVVLVGIVDNDAVVKVDFIVRARAAGASARDAVLEAGRARLRPIVMTTTTTALGLLPMALGLGSGADLQAPMAITVIAGLVVATALTLIVVPVLYLVVA